MKRSYLWAGVIAIALGLWLGSGEWFSAPGEEPELVEAAEPVVQEEQPFKVVVERFSSQPRVRIIDLRGRTEAKATVEVRARTAGIVETAGVEDGTAVGEGDLLCELDLTSREAKIAEAEAQLQSAERDYQAAQKLAKQDFVTKAKLAAEKARYDAAKAALEQVTWDLKWTEIKAPVAGVVVDLAGEVGTYLQPGHVCATIAVLDPLIVTGQLAERDVGDLSEGQKARVRLVTGEEVEGIIRYIAPRANVETRTFKIEVEIDNPGNRIRSGLTAEIYVPLPPEPAHLLPSSLLGLNDAGQLGVRAVEGDRVKFMPVALIGQSREGAWVGGLPDEVTLITVGQDYVLDGQRIEAVAASEQIAEGAPS